MPAFGSQVQGVHDVLKAHLGEAVAIYVARMSTALLRDPDLKGMRSIEVASGLSRETVWTYLPGEKETSYGLLHCAQRGSENSWEDQQVGRYIVTGKKQNALGADSSVTLSTSSPVPSSPGLLSTSEGQAQGVRNLAGVLAEGRERLLDPAVLEALDPARDIWAPRSPLAGPLDYRGAGHRGWALGLLLGLADVSLTYPQVRELLGLGERQTRNVVAQLEQAGLAERRTVGRMVWIDFVFSSALVEPYADLFVQDHDRTERAHHKHQRHQRERALLASRKTLHGLRAWLLIRYRRKDWPPQSRALYVPENELLVASMFEKPMNRRLALAA